MFSQWFDRLLNSPLEGASCLVGEILRRAAQEYSQALALPFRVLMTSMCGWQNDERTLLEQFLARLSQTGRSDAVPLFTEFAFLLLLMLLLLVVVVLEVLIHGTFVFKTCLGLLKTRQS